MKNLHSSGKMHCLETPSPAHHARQTTTVPPWSPLPLAETKLQSLFPTTAVLPPERLIVLLLLVQGETTIISQDAFILFPFLGDLLNSPSPYIWAIQALGSSQPALNHARKLADGCWQQARLCPHSAPVRKQKTSGDASAN